MSNGYYVSRDNGKNETVFLEFDKMDGYQVNPKVQNKNGIKVNKIVFLNSQISEKVIRKKIDKRIEYLLHVLSDEDSSSDGEDALKKSLLVAEKLRMQIINNYSKYLGNTYGSLTLKKIQIIVNELRYRLYVLEESKINDYYQARSDGRKGR